MKKALLLSAALSLFCFKTLRGPLSPCEQFIEIAKTGKTENIVKLLTGKDKSKYLKAINCIDDYGKTPLHHAAEKGGTEVAKTLLERKAKRYIRDITERTALHYASENGHTEIVQMLIDPKKYKIKKQKKMTAKEIDAQDENLITPLYLSAKKLGTSIKNKQEDIPKYQRICLILIEEGASKSTTNINGRTPYDIAKISITEDTEQYISFLNPKHKPRLDNLDELRKNFINFIRKKNIEQAKTILGKQLMNVNFMERTGGNTPLHLAAIHTEDSNFIKNLFQYGAKADSKNLSGYTPLHIAAQHGNLAMVTIVTAPQTYDLQNVIKDAKKLITIKSSKATGSKTALNIADEESKKKNNALTKLQKKKDSIIGLTDKEKQESNRLEGEIKKYKEIISLLKQEKN